MDSYSSALKHQQLLIILSTFSWTHLALVSFVLHAEIEQLLSQSFHHTPRLEDLKDYFVP